MFMRMAGIASSRYNIYIHHLYVMPVVRLQQIGDSYSFDGGL